MGGNRNKGLDICRMLACALVIINHNNSKVMLQVDDMSLAWLVTVAVVYLTKVAVPIFFMITGYNLIHRNDDRPKYFERMFRILVVLAVFTLLYYIWKCMIGVYELRPGALGVADFLLGYVRVLFRDVVTDSYWYLYAYLGLLICMPAFQKLALGASERITRRVLAASLIVLSVIPAVNVFFPGIFLSEHFELPGITMSVAYLFVGHVAYLNRNGGRRIAGKAVCSLIAGLIFNACMMFAEWHHTGGTSCLSMSEIWSPGIIACSISLFALALKLRMHGGLAEKIIEVIVPLTFGVYLIGDFMCSSTHLIYYWLCPHMNRLLAVAIQDVAALLCGCLIVALVRCVPAIRKWI